MKKEVKVVLIPTYNIQDYYPEGTLIGLKPNEVDRKEWNYKVAREGVPYLMYCKVAMYIVDENAPININKQEWFTNTKANWISRDFDGGLKPDCYAKIVATTDPKLIADGIPSISEQFIQQYVECQGKGKVMIEMEEDYLTTLKFELDINDGSEDTYVPKLDQSGNVILSIAEVTTVKAGKGISMPVHTPVIDIEQHIANNAIEFAEWVASNKYYYAKEYWNQKNEIEGHPGVYSYQKYTTTQLYQLWQQQRKK